MKTPDRLTAQQKVDQFVTPYRLDCSIENRMLDLVSEVGELSKEILKSSNYGHANFKKSEQWELELGDAIFSLIALASATEINLDTALDNALTKYQNRIDAAGTPASGQ